MKLTEHIVIGLVGMIMDLIDLRILLLQAIICGKFKIIVRMTNSVETRDFKSAGNFVLATKIIERAEGYRNVPLECPFSINRAPVWRINNSLYDLFSLPSPLLPTTYGLNIAVIDRSQNNTRFQCLAPSGNGLSMSADETVTLVVSPSGKLSKLMGIKIKGGNIFCACR